MILRRVFLSIFLCLALRPAVKAQVEVKNQRYQNVLISFSPNVPSDKGRELLQSIQELLEQTSDVLGTAIGIRIASATFLLPPSWPKENFKNFNISKATSAQLDRRPDISVDATSYSPFGKKPVALKHGGCGVPGHQIILPLDFLSSTEEYPKGKLLAREWLKYRYGVFEENGFKYDWLYPHYYRTPGRSQITVTECTNSDVKYTFKRDTNKEDIECDMDNKVDFESCIPQPDKESAAKVTSSLMYFNKHFSNMEHICGKDGRRHLNTIQNMQNVLCNGRSIWDVIKLSEDFKSPQEQPTHPDPKTIKFSYVQESKPQIVVLLENSDNLHEKQEQIGFALRRFYYDLPAKSDLLLITYNSKDDQFAVVPFGSLHNPDKRKDLATIADFTYSQKDICHSCVLDDATRILLQLGNSAKSSILLITASNLDRLPAFYVKIKRSGISLDVLRFHDEKDPVDKSYEALKDNYSSFSYRPVSKSLNDSEIFSSLYSFLMSAGPKYKDDFEIKTDTLEMSGNDNVTIPQDETASLYTLWLAKAFSSSGSVQCKAGEADVALKPGIKGTDITSYTFDPVNADIVCKLSSTKQPPILTQVQMTTQKGHYLHFDVWIDDMSTEKEQLPIKIYAKVFYGGYPVKGANVRTIVTSDRNVEEIVTMLDNGRGEPDITRGDGVYSGVFDRFLTAGDYKVIVKIDDGQGGAKIGKEHKARMPATCCGSRIISESSKVPAFNMEKTVTYTAKNKMPDDGYRPFRIVDLQVQIFNRETGMVILVWNEPVGERVNRFDLKLFENREDAINNFDNKGKAFNPNGISRGRPGEVYDAYEFDMYTLENGTTYYAAVRSWNKFNRSSEISNVVEFHLPKDSEEDGKGGEPGQTSGKKTTEIVVGVVAGIAVLCILGFLAYYFFVQKPKREEQARARHQAESAQRTSNDLAGQ